MFFKQITACTAGAAFLLCGVAHATLVVTPTDNAGDLVDALQAPSNGITVDGTTINLVGATNQQGIYSGFDLDSPDGPAIVHGDGVVLTSGSANFSTTENTVNNFSVGAGTGSDADLSAELLAAGLNSTTHDANVLEFEFTVDDLDNNSVAAQFVFATDEFPTQSVTDGMAVFIDGVNYAFFPDGSLVSNQQGVTTDFFNLNTVGTDATTGYGIEWNGISNVLTVTGLLDAALAVHTFKLVIADTSDTIFDSAVFFSGLLAGFTTGDGGIGDPMNEIPIPAALPLFLAGIAGLGFARRKKKA